MAELSTTAWEAATNVVNGFQGATADEQGSAAAQLARVEPFVDIADEAPRIAFADAVQQALNAREWFASDEDARAQAALFRAVGVIAEAYEGNELDNLLLADAQLIPPTGHDPTTLRRLREVGMELSETARDTLLEAIEKPDWSDPARGAAVLRLRTDLAGGGAHLTAAQRARARQHQDLADAEAALVSWLESDPTPVAVTSFVRLGGLTAQGILRALASWAEGRSERERTQVALELLSMNFYRGPTLAAICTGGIDEGLVVARVDNRIRKLDTLKYREALAQTLAWISIARPAPRSRLVKLMAWLLGPKRKKGDRRVFALLLSALEPAPLPEADTKRLRKAITAACKRKGGPRWKLTRTQGERLVGLGVKPQEDWFGRSTARKIFDIARRADEGEEEASDEIPSAEDDSAKN